MSEGPKPNLLYYGDNLDILRRYVEDESVDLVYLDPPFDTDTHYHVVFREKGLEKATDAKAFENPYERVTCEHVLF